MNAQNAHLFLPLVQALADGKTIQFVTFGGDWVDYNPETDFKFNGDPSLYRIKPEPPKSPREWTGLVVSRRSDSRAGTYGFQLSMKDGTVLDAPNPGEILTLREVLPETP